MLFSSITFLYFFLPIVLGLYFAVPFRFKNFILLIASLFFYFAGEPIYSILMVASSLSGWLHGLWIGKWKGQAKAKIPLISSIVFGLAGLLFFKYTDFFLDNINGIFGTSIGLLKLALPIGISFYTFQILSYTIDVYLGKAAVQKSFLDFTTYVAFFPQLIAGPIVRYTQIEAELASRTHSVENFALGARRFLVGLGKKVLIANVLGEVGNLFSQSTDKSVLFYWIAAIAFTLHIYFDFSGYSDMAIGLGRIFGFKFPENFNYPFISRSVTEFWRRWHMSLSTWFRDYIYIPLGGNRVSQWKHIRNIFAVWLLTGFWHGASWNFIVWGLMFGVLLILEKFFLARLLEKLPKFCRHIYVMFLVVISFVIFNANSMGEAIVNLKGMFGFADVPLISSDALYYLRSYAVVFILAIIGSTPLIRNLGNKLSANARSEKVLNAAEPVLLAALLIVVTAFLIDGSFNPFLYFRF
ncbi:MAG: MBOAT family protein [Clostridia bacterium]|nr:MBOAT family protein [Clostridia bacterium]